MPKKYFKSDHFGGGGSLSDSHLRSILKVWVTHYNGARPHMALGLGVPDRPAGAVRRVDKKSRHHLGARPVLCARPVLGGLSRNIRRRPCRI